MLRAAGALRHALPWPSLSPKPVPPPALSQPAVDVTTNSARLFSEMCELLQAATHVVGIRTVRLATAGPTPDERDRLEFHLMSVEKSEAASESLHALSLGWMDLAMALTKDTSDHLLATTAAAATLASSRSAEQWLEHQTELWRLATEHPANPLQLAGLVTGLLEKVLAPVYGRAMANAKRLSAP